MSNQNNSVVSVKDLVVTLHGDDGNERDIHYGSFDIYPGDFILVKGRNGSGKSTFLRLFHLQGIRYFSVKSGDILFREEGFPKTSIHTYSESQISHLNRAISFIGQEERFCSNDSAYSYIYYVCKRALEGNHSLTHAQKEAMLHRVDEMIREYYDLYLAKSFECKKYKTFKNKNVRAWSGGQQKMINVLAGVIKAQVCGLKLVLMDEPLNNLDGRNKDILNKLITQLRNSNVAILTITHCQIFDGVNKTLLLTETEDGTRYATLHEYGEPAHSGCLEAYN